MEEKKTNQTKMTKKQDEAVKKALKAEAERHHKELVEKENKLSKVAKVAPNDSFIILKDVNKIYDNHVQAVFNFNLEIKQKEFIVFVGPSGCGKSTTLRMIAGLEDITYGDLFIDGKYCNLTPPKDRNLAMVFQNYALYPHMNVYSNMAFGIKIRKVKTPLFEPNERLTQLQKEKSSIIKKLNKIKDDQVAIDSYQAKVDELNLLIKEEEKNRKPIMFIDKAMIKYLNKEIQKNEEMISELKSDLTANEKIIEKVNKSLEKAKEDLKFYSTTEVQKYKYAHLPKEEIDARVQNAARILNLEPYLDRKPSAMSGGQRQRVALGRAIVRNAKVLLMDEPLSNLDAKLRVQMRSEIAQLHQRIGSTTIYVTHDQTEAMTMADRIVVMKDGHVQQIDTPSQIYDHPSNTFVAGFIGSPAMNIFKASVKANTIHLPDCFKIEMLPEQVKALKKYIEDQTKILTKKIDNIKDMLSKLKPDNQNDQGNIELLKKRETQYLQTLERFDDYKKGKNLEVEFGIRAEDIISGPDMIKFKNLSLPYKALVTVAEFLGHEYFIHYDFGEAPIVAKVPVTKDLIKSGDKVEVKINKEKIHLFEFGSKETIF